jgi:predicted Fe-S protein YdhL (DUF1289 family)
MTSPCIGICKIDPATKFCRGCGRTVKETRKWLEYSKEERTKVLEELKKRDFEYKNRK